MREDIERSRKRREPTPVQTSNPQVREESPGIRAESNFEEYPLFNFATRGKSIESYEFAKWTQGRDGIGLRKVWRVMPSAELGAPGSTDQDVYLAVLELLERKGGMPESGEFEFTLYELLAILGWSDAGNNYRLLRRSLRRISVTSVESEQAFYSKETESLLTDTFKLWTYHSSASRPVGRGRSEGGVRERHIIRFDPIFIRSWHAFYLKGIDSGFYWRLNSGVAKRLYRLIDKMRGDSLGWRQELFELRNQIPLAKYRYPSKVKEKLAPAHRELLDKGFLDSVDYSGCEVVYRVSVDFAQHSRALELSGTADELIAIERLLSEGVRGDMGRDLVARFGAETCLRYAEVIQYQEGIRNRAGWLVKAIENRYDVEVPGGAGPEEAPAASQGSLFPGEDAPLGEADSTAARSVVPDPDPGAERIWLSVLAEVSGHVNAPSLGVWFEGAVPVGLSDDELVVSVHNAVAQEYIETRFKAMLEEELYRQFRPAATLRFVIDPEPVGKC